MTARPLLRKVSVAAFAFGLLFLISASGAILSFVRCGVLLGQHLDQQQIDSGQISFDDVVNTGGILFTGNLSEMPGFGSGTRPGFNHMIGPDSFSCLSCHNQITAPNGLVINLPGGAGDFNTNIFNGTLSPTSSAGANERNTPQLFGVGAKEQLAREMSADLQGVQVAAVAEATSCHCIVLKELTSKGVNFGWVLVNPDGSIQSGGADGVDSDLVIKPFGHKGTTADLRTFSIDPMNRHHGLQAEEKFGKGTDPDEDGVPNELSVGDITALALWQATRPAPAATLPSDLSEIKKIDSGQDLFGVIGCSQCHIPALPLDNSQFQLKNPLDPNHAITFDLADTLGLEKGSDGKIMVPLYGDLKRHDMGDALSDPKSESGVSASLFMTSELWGVGSTGPYLHDGRAPTLQAAIEAHGGEARRARDSFMALSEDGKEKVLQFLRSLAITPEHVVKSLPVCN